MGLLTNVMKKGDAVSAPVEEKKILLNINSRMEDLKLQNLENAKFLRGLSRKIETELQQLRSAEENRSIEVKDDSEVILGIERVQKALEEINNNDVIEEIDRIHKNLEEFASKIDTSVSKLDTEQLTGVMDGVEVLRQDVSGMRQNIDVTKQDTGEIRQNVDVMQQDIGAMRQNIDVTQQDTGAMRQNIDVMQQRISEIRQQEEQMQQKLDAIQKRLEQLEKLDALEKLSGLDELNKLDRIDEISGFVEEVSGKVNSLITMPGNIRNLMEIQNSDVKNDIKELCSQMGAQRDRKISSIKTMVGISLWMGFLNACLMIAYILGIFN